MKHLMAKSASRSRYRSVAGGRTRRRKNRRGKKTRRKYFGGLII